jgi:hypothetical protein
VACDIGIIPWAIFGLPLLGAVPLFFGIEPIDYETLMEQQVEQQFWRDAVLVRTCDDGTDIYRMPNGEFVTVELETVEDPATACN